MIQSTLKSISRLTMSTVKAYSTSSTNSETKYALIQGSSRGLGLEIARQLLQRPDYRVIATSREPFKSPGLQELASAHGDRIKLMQMDITKEQDIIACAASVTTSTPYLNMLFNVSGILHIPGEMMPETALKRVTQEALYINFATNAMGPILVSKAFEPLLALATKHGASPEAPALIANISARASKTALNQLTKTMSLEFKRRKQNIACVLLHPGTCATDLSAPFQKNVPEGKLFPVERGARQLLEVAESINMNSSGCYLAWDGTPIPW